MGGGKGGGTKRVLRGYLVGIWRVLSLLFALFTWSFCSLCISLGSFLSLSLSIWLFHFSIPSFYFLDPHVLLFFNHYLASPLSLLFLVYFIFLISLSLLPVLYLHLPSLFLSLLPLQLSLFYLSFRLRLILSFSLVPFHLSPFFAFPLFSPLSSPRSNYFTPGSTLLTALHSDNRITSTKFECNINPLCTHG